jgi:hypothetical protein
MSSTSALVGKMSDEIAGADYRAASATFCQLVVDGAPVKEVAHQAIASAAPFLQVPSHVLPKSTGDLHYVNYDHTILGWRAAVRLAPRIPSESEVLPLLQAMWYLPQGLNIYEQSICEFPGSYAKRGCVGKLPEDPEGIRFDRPTWVPPRIHFEDHAPITPKSASAGLQDMTDAITEGDRDTSYGLFLGLSADPENHHELMNRALFAGIIDLQDTLINRKGYQNLGHRAIRARAMVDLIDYFGWEASQEVVYTVLPDLATAPRLFGLYLEISELVNTDLRRLQPIPKRVRPVSDPELSRLCDVVLWAGPLDVNAAISDLFIRGYGTLDVIDALAISFQRYFVNVVENPRGYAQPTHAFDYMNVVATWIRGFENAHQPKAVYMAARFMNDTVRLNSLFPRDPRFELGDPSEHRAAADKLPEKELLAELLDAIVREHAPRAVALFDSYDRRGGRMSELISTVGLAASHFQDDPHIMRNCTSSIEEWTLSQHPRRNEILRGWVKLQSRYAKRGGELEALALYKQYFPGATVAI